ncbi:hypothetical protein [Thermoflexus sp.]|uniref:hypothetical protein n=1 Tax=Thermoflexus sp. TaxID=1969742 RepID=UPI002ADD5662|nr:hypothetical protein [Thermoflexus sp.]
MAGREELIALAERIADAMPEMTRNEWMRWVQIATRHGLEKAVRHAEQLSNDVTMRPAVKRANQLITQAIRSHLFELKKLTPHDQQLVLGYVAWHLAIQTLRGSWRESGE